MCVCVCVRACVRACVCVCVPACRFIAKTSLPFPFKYPGDLG